MGTKKTGRKNLFKFLKFKNKNLKKLKKMRCLFI